MEIFGWLFTIGFVIFVAAQVINAFFTEPVDISGDVEKFYRNRDG